MKSAQKQLLLEWFVGHHTDESAPPETRFPAVVPGAVQLDYAKAFSWPPYWYGENFKNYMWMEDSFWTYRTSFAKPALKTDQRFFFVSKGIDYKFTISLNRIELFRQEGMFRPVELDITDLLLDSNELLITIFPVPKSHHQKQDHSQANTSVKPPVSYGWDWHPRLIPLGIWDDTYLEIKNSSHLTEVDFFYNLSDDLTSADIVLSVQGVNLLGRQWTWTLCDENGGTCFVLTGAATDVFQIEYNLKNIRLWWPHDFGRPALYSSELTISEGETICDRKKVKVGFRRVALVMNAGAWDEPKTFPKSRSLPPVQLEINGRRIFAKGSNWVPPEIFPGAITKQRYEELLDLAVEANFNILRIWGGGIVNKESFYELCDEKGILVWQDFILACNNYAESPAYLKVLESEATAIIKRLRQHPCLALWCGGNELFNNWSRMTDQSLPLRLLNSLCYQLDRQTPFLPTTPVMGMGHGHYVFRDAATDEEVFQIMARAKNTAYTEFGVPSPSSLDVLASFIPQEELWPPKPGGVWEAHHAYNAWLGDTWLMRDVIEFYFGACENLEQLVEFGQLLQCEGYKAIYEEARRQKPFCSMAINWCFNEPWPTAANNSLINWPLVKKPAFAAVKQACRPVMASARIPKFVWQAGEEFACELWLLNDSLESLVDGLLLVQLTGDETITLLEWRHPTCAANENIKGPRVQTKLPDWQTAQITLVLHDASGRGLDSHYSLMYKG